jgi:hypothetical protein
MFITSTTIYVININILFNKALITDYHNIKKASKQKLSKRFSVHI